RRMGTSQTYIAAVEHGKKNITFSTLARYARACGKKVALI
ncbi:MAG: helix-turn-helix transcriptional regulator, partial [Lentisphaeria bacterium]|nr:helix-turn-helix transcriptional regulator [Lentisphaeria bacterium]